VSGHVLRSEAPPSSIEDELRATLDAQRAAVLAKRYPSAKERKALLKRLLRMLVDNEQAIVDAQVADFRASNEAIAFGMLPSVLVTKQAIRKVRRWMRPEKRWVNPIFGLWASRIDFHPKGVVGIISPWNYPLLLTIGPLAGAIAAGNRVMIKLSEHSPKFAEVFARLVAETFSRDEVAVFTGDGEMAAAFSRLPFDHLAFTGSTEVGRLVYKAAADNLTPVTLELGGKSPAIIDRGFPFDRLDPLVYGKLLNAGQSCAAPDYMFVHEDDVDAFIAGFRRATEKLWPSWASRSDMSDIINERHLARLRGYLEEAATGGATLHEINPGNEDAQALGRRICPTLITDVDEDMRVMQDEIFGPILPIKTYRDVSEAVEYINAHPHPLVLYVYSHDRKMVDGVRLATQSGAFIVNYATIQVGFDELPFGGIGASGIGNYHGSDGFKEFSHERVYSHPILNATPLVFPPYGRLFHWVMDFLFRR
jgi:coniferyl-aldehyde dehydrogenase